MLYDVLDVYCDMFYDEELIFEGLLGLFFLEELDVRCFCCFGFWKEGDLVKNKVDYFVFVGCVLYCLFGCIKKKLKGMYLFWFLIIVIICRD